MNTTNDSWSSQREQFDHAFYEMLGIHENITNSLRLEMTKKISSNVVSQTDSEVKNGRDVFAYMYEDLLVYDVGIGGGFVIPDKIQYIGLKGLFQAHKDAYSVYEANRAVSSLDHYFRQFYCIFKMIYENDKLSFEKKYEHASIVRSTLSHYELVLLFYNCLSSNGCEKFKPLVEEYSLLKNLREDLLADVSECKKYKNTAFYPNPKT